MVYTLLFGNSLPTITNACDIGTIKMSQYGKTAHIETLRAI